MNHERIAGSPKYREERAARRMQEKKDRDERRRIKRKEKSDERRRERAERIDARIQEKIEARADRLALRRFKRTALREVSDQRHISAAYHRDRKAEQAALRAARRGRPVTPKLPPLPYSEPAMDVPSTSAPAPTKMSSTELRIERSLEKKRIAEEVWRREHPEEAAAEDAMNAMQDAARADRRHGD